ncbi:hypothetical protein [Haloarcula sp. CGMCC 1.2071]
MTPKTYWEYLTWEFPSPNTPSVLNGSDGALFVDPHDPLMV